MWQSVLDTTQHGQVVDCLLIKCGKKMCPVYSKREQYVKLYRNEDEWDSDIWLPLEKYVKLGRNSFQGPGLGLLGSCSFISQHDG